MLHYAVVSFIFALLAALLGVTGIAAGAAGIAKILFVLFMIGAAVAYVMSVTGRRRDVLVHPPTHISRRRST